MDNTLRLLRQPDRDDIVNANNQGSQSRFPEGIGQIFEISSAFTLSYILKYLESLTLISRHGSQGTPNCANSLMIWSIIKSSNTAHVHWVWFFIYIFKNFSITDLRCYFKLLCHRISKKRFTICSHSGRHCRLHTRQPLFNNSFAMRPSSIPSLSWRIYIRVSNTRKTKNIYVVSSFSSSWWSCWFWVGANVNIVEPSRHQSPLNVTSTRTVINNSGGNEAPFEQARHGTFESVLIHFYSSCSSSKCEIYFQE